ncbi:MAG: acetolactate synthase large subunit [Burkholderiaceae bacterium]
MNGAQALVRTLLASDLDVCFTNPGTSEMHFVAALDSVPGMRCVLGLFEGVVTGAADGYARMTGKPAATLLHLGPGLGNGLANVHNARKGRSPMVNIVGEHATYHLQYETPLRSDIAQLAGACSDWVHTSTDADGVSRDAAQAVARAREGGRIATLILPADTAWNEAPSGPAEPIEPAPLNRVAADRVEAAARILRGPRRAALMLSGPVLIEPWVSLATAIAQRTGCRLLAQQSNARMSRGRGHPDVVRVPYVVAQARQALADIDELVLLGANPPASFFAYPDQPNMMVREDCALHALAGRDDDLVACLRDLAAALDLPADARPTIADRAPLAPANGALDADAIMQTVTALLPENAVLCDESVSSGRQLFKFTGHAVPHDYLQTTGGAIGCGAPLATGAAIGAPGRPVVSLQADGSMMYTLQALWTQAREQLNVTTVILANRAYRILQGELRSVGVENPGERARQMLSLDSPAIDWVSLARGMGVPGRAVDSAEALGQALIDARGEPGPFLIEARMP